MGWVFDREVLQMVADALNQVAATAVEGPLTVQFIVSPNEDCLEFHCQAEVGKAVIKAPVSEEGELIEIHGPGRMVYSVPKINLVMCGLRGES